LAFVNTNNKDPYAGPCTPGPDLWSAAVLAINETNGNWVWGFQGNAHELWDYDCSWWQAMANETIGGVNTQVIFKTCKAGYMFELNAVTGKMIWAWTPPASIEPRCQYCYMLNPLNRTQMTYPFFNPNAFGTNQGTLCSPCTYSFESESAYDPTLNYVYAVSQNLGAIWYSVPFNSSNYHTTGGTRSSPLPTGRQNLLGGGNSSAEAVDASTGNMVWNYFIPTHGYRGGMTVSGGVLYLTLLSGDLLMLNAKTGAPIKDLFIGGPMEILPSIGATASGTMEVIIPEGIGDVARSLIGAEPGNLIALSLQNVPTGGGGTTATVTVGTAVTQTITVGGVTTTVTGGAVTATTTATVSASGGGGVSSTTLYGVAAVAVIFIIATGYFAMRGRKPAS
jgi:hypothetical protein